MTSEEISVVIIVLAVVLVCCVVIGSISAVLRKRRLVEFHKGPGNPEEPAPAGPWRRFSGALAAPYARPEWLRVQEARRVHTEDQIYFGFASTLTPSAVITVLRTDWGVKNAQQAQARLSSARDVITEHAAAIVIQRGGRGGAEAFRDKLLRAGAPAGVVDRFLRQLDGVGEDHQGGSDVDGLAFDIARVANLARWSGFAHYVEQEQGEGHLDALGVAAAAVFRDWDDFGESYLAGQATRFKGGSKQYTRAVEWLRTDFTSPWFRQPWIMAVKPAV